MRYQQNAVLTSLSRAQQFITDNSERLSAINPTAVKELNDVAEELATLSVTQESGTRGSKGETARNQSLRTVLRQKHMAPIAAVAKYKLQSVPEFVAMTLPPVTVSAQSLVAAATAMADAAAPHAQTFIDSGLAATFVDDLRSAAKAVSASIVERGNLQGRRNGATAGLAATGRIAEGLCRYLDQMDEIRVAAEVSVTMLHVSAIARAARAEDEATRMSEVVAAELAALVNRKLTEAKASAA